MISEIKISQYFYYNRLQRRDYGLSLKMFSDNIFLFFLLNSFPFLIFLKYFQVYPFLLIMLDLYEISWALAKKWYECFNFCL